MQADHYRTYTADLELRKQGDGRTIFGIAVPYRRPMRIDESLIEQFAPGPFGNQLRAPFRVPFARDHIALGGSLIGTTTLLRDDAAGLYGEWKVSKTPLGDETLALFEDGALRDLSVGFREGRNRQLPGGITERVTATLLEVAMVLEGAYGELATAHGVRVAVARYEPPATPNLDRARAELTLPAL